MRARTLAWPAALLAVALLHGLAAWKAPPTVPLPEVRDHVGERVAVAGRLRDVRVLDDARLVEVADDTVYLPALLRGEPDRPLEPGDEARLVGIVGLHQGAHELRGRSDDVTVLETRDRPLSPGAVSRHPHRLAGTPVHVAGWVEGSPDGWRLARDGSSLALEPANGTGLREDMEVVAHGTLTYRPSEARYVLEDARWRRR